MNTSYINNNIKRDRYGSSYLTIFIAYSHGTIAELSPYFLPLKQN